MLILILLNVMSIEKKRLRREIEANIDYALFSKNPYFTNFSPGEIAIIRLDPTIYYSWDGRLDQDLIKKIDAFKLVIARATKIRGADIRYALSCVFPSEYRGTLTVIDGFILKPNKPMTFWHNQNHSLNPNPEFTIPTLTLDPLPESKYPLLASISEYDFLKRALTAVNKNAFSNDGIGSITQR